MIVAPDEERRDGVAKSAAKTGLRLLGIATSAARSLPDFVIIGGKRCGTTSLFRNLATHPSFVPLFPAAQKIKGTHFFDTNYNRGMAWYRSHFPVRAKVRPGSGNERRFTGEASPYYLFHPLAAKRAGAHIPRTKLIVLLRNPIDRAYSHYRERVRHGVEKLSFEAALEAENQRLEGEEERIVRDGAYYSFAHEHLSYVRQGRYARALDRWLEAFPREQFLFIRSEEMFMDPTTTYDRLTRFLDVSPLPRDTFERHNFHPGDPIDAKVREQLEATFAEDNDRLVETIGIDLFAPSARS